MTEKTGVWEPLRKAAPQVHWTRIENLVGTGMSDVNGCLNGVEVWIENKLVHGNQITFQPMQPAWIIQRLMHGGRVFVLARKNDMLYLYGWEGLVKLLRTVKPQGKHLVADYRAAVPLVIVQKPFDWEAVTGAVFGHRSSITAKAA